MNKRVSVLVAALLMISGTAQAYDPPYAQWPMPRTTPVIELGRRGMNPPSEFALFNSYWANQPSWFNVETSGIPFRQDVVLIPATSTPAYPRAGLHMIEMYPGGRTAFYARFLQELRSVVTGWITPVDYNGLLVLDYEWFSPNWTGHRNTPSNEGRTAIDEDYLDDWRETLRETRATALAGLNAAQQEEYFKREWLAMSREFFERAYNEVKSLRPQAKVTFYNAPVQSYWPWRDPAQAEAMRLGNGVEAGWFYQMVDVICPSVYPLYQAVPENQTPGRHQDRQSDFESYVRANIAEAIRLANGKPVYPYVAFQYHPSMGSLAYTVANDFNALRPIEIAREMGCNGVIIWSHIQTQAQFDSTRTFFQSTYAPFLRQMSQMQALAPANPAPITGGGGGGGGATGGGATGGPTGGSTSGGGATGGGTSGGGTTGGATGGGTTGGGGTAGGTTGGTTGGGSAAGGGGGGGSGVVSVGGGTGGATGPSAGDGSGSGSQVISVGGGSSGGSSSGGGSGVVSVGGGGTSGGSSPSGGETAAAGGAVGGSGGGSGGGASGGGSGGTAITASAASGISTTGAVSSFRNESAGGGSGEGAGGSAGGTSGDQFAQALAAGPVDLGEGGTAVMPMVDLSDASVRVGGADLASLDAALLRALGGGEGPADLEGARIVKPGGGDAPALASADPSTKVRIVRPGLNGPAAPTGPALAAGTPALPSPIKIVRPTGGAGGATSGTALAAGARFVRPGQLESKPTAPIKPAETVITGVPTQP